MISQNVKDYIDKHSFCPEHLSRDWESFLDLLYSEGGSISAILWWDYCKISQQHESIGSGGYRDPENPEYMFAETQLYEDGFDTKSLEEVKEYIIRMKNAGIGCNNRYISFNLVPSFDIRE